MIIIKIIMILSIYIISPPLPLPPLSLVIPLPLLDFDLSGEKWLKQRKTFLQWHFDKNNVFLMFIFSSPNSVK